MTHPACLPVEALLIDCRIRTGRRSGPGGQHRNKVETAVTIEHLPTGLCAEATERRSQFANRLVAIFRLRLMLAVELRSPRVTEGLSAEPLTALWKQRTASRRIAVAAEHEDFPSILAEAMDNLALRDWKVHEASERLGISSTQLIRLLKKHPPALQMLNQRRKILGLVPLL